MQTSSAANKPLLSSSRGFTLMEILIVVAIIGAVVAIGVPKLTNKRGKMRSEIQRIAVLSRELFNAARLQNRTYRLAFEMNKETAKFHVESANGQITVLNEEQQKELQDKSSVDREEYLKSHAPQFEVDTKYVKTPEQFPTDLRIDSIEYAGRKTGLGPPDDDEKVGRAYIHYFPQGLAEQALIHLSDGKNLHWTISIHPLTGKAIVQDGTLTLKDLGL